MLRATNTGMSAIITPRGKIYDQMEPFKNSYLLHNLKIDTATSFYTTHGDFWVYAILLFAVLIILYTTTKRLLGPVKIEF